LTGSDNPATIVLDADSSLTAVFLKVLQVDEVIPHGSMELGSETIATRDTSFAIRLQDSDGIDMTDPSSIRFTIHDGVNEYIRDLADLAVVSVTKLSDEDDTEVTSLWAAYHRASEEQMSEYPFDTEIDVKVDVRNSAGLQMAQAAFRFKIETQTEHDQRDANSPATDAIHPSELPNDEPYDAGVEVTHGALEGAQIIYSSNDAVTPRFGPAADLSPFDLADVETFGGPINLEPSTVFTTPVKLFIPCGSHADLSELSIYLHNGSGWVLAVDNLGNEQPGGQGWYVPRSRINLPDAEPPGIEIKVYHFSGVLAGTGNGQGTAGADPPINPISTSSGGGCWINLLTGSVGW
jgi:hypothetical protein